MLTGTAPRLGVGVVCFCEGVTVFAPASYVCCTTVLLDVQAETFPYRNDRKALIPMASVFWLCLFGGTSL